jgi:hypothetical protein
MPGLDCANHSVISSELADLAEHICLLTRKIDRSDPIAEAQVAVAEVLSCLTGLCQDDCSADCMYRTSAQIRENALERALAAGRAAVGALMFALAETRDSMRAK